MPVPVVNTASGSPPHDPHALPSFSTTSVIKPSRVVLYLPPLLSSLPESLSSDASAAHVVNRIKNSEHSPKLTDTRLPDIDPASHALHLALHDFRSTTDNYSAEPYEESFNWDELVLPLDAEREWYVVAFRSRRKKDSNSDSLYAADAAAHAEAVQNGGLILYWYGVPNAISRNNLATCIWQSRAHAIAANSRPSHAKAARLAASSYEMYTLERYVLRKVRGESGLTVEPYTGGDVGW